MVGRFTNAQTTAVVADATSHEPVAHASLYCKEGGRFLSAISDMHGRATVSFTFHRLTVSHLNYETATLRQLPDTIFLKPKFRSTGEVVVTNKEPEWIRRKLRQVVKTKQKNYFTHDATEHFVYHTQSLGTNHIYRYHLEGRLRSIASDRKHYIMLPDSSHIVASDSTRLTDTANLQRMLYEDFMMELDNGFISSHKWGENPDYNGHSPDEVELHYRSKHHTDDRGRVVNDTARCIILQATRYTGTATNRRERMSALLYAMARAISGYRVDTWIRDYRVSYALRPDGTLYPAEVRYKLYYAGEDGTRDKDQQAFSDQTGGGFPNMEATLTLTPLALQPSSPDPQHYTLPPSWYLRLSSEAEKQHDIMLSNLPATFSIFEQERDPFTLSQ